MVGDTESKDANKAAGWAYAFTTWQISEDTTDTALIAAFSFRIFDLFTDVGVFQFTTQKVDFQFVMGLWATPVKYISLVSSVIGFLLFVPEAFVFGQKLGLSKNLGQAAISSLCTNQVARLPSASWVHRSSWKAYRN